MGVCLFVFVGVLGMGTGGCVIVEVLRKEMFLYSAGEICPPHEATLSIACTEFGSAAVSVRPLDLGPDAVVFGGSALTVARVSIR